MFELKPGLQPLNGGRGLWLWQDRHGVSEALGDIHLLSLELGLWAEQSRGMWRAVAKRGRPGPVCFPAASILAWSGGQGWEGAGEADHRLTGSSQRG